MTDTGRQHFTIRALIFSIALLSLCAIGLADDLQTIVDRHIDSSRIGQARVGVHLVDMKTGKVLAAHDASEKFIPASNMKLLTTAAALDTLGPDFAFRTELRAQGQTLLIVGDGDPAFGDPALLAAHDMTVDDLLTRWVDVTRKAGLRRVDRLVIDDRMFDRNFVHPTWPRDQLDEWYCAPVGGLNFNNNCLDIYADPTAAGRPAVVTTLPSRPGMTVKNNTKSGGKNAIWATRDSATHVTVHGTVPKKLVAPINLTVADPGAYFAHAFAANLSAAGIKVDQLSRAVGAGDALPDSRLIAVVRTPLPVVLNRTNRDSQNLFAEALLKRLGHEATDQPGTWKNGAAAMKKSLAAPHLLGPLAGEITIADGSGMSRDNRTTPRALTALLVNVHRSAAMNRTYADSLSTGGEDGTLRRRFRKGFHGAVLGKSGYISGVVALSGYLVYDHRAYAFSILLNDYKGPAWRGKQFIDRMLDQIDAELHARHQRDASLVNHSAE